MFAKNAINPGYGRNRADTQDEFDNDNMELKRVDDTSDNQNSSSSFKTANDRDNSLDSQGTS